jgi:hypothetical protein
MAQIKDGAESNSAPSFISNDPFTELKQGSVNGHQGTVIPN